MDTSWLRRRLTVAEAEAEHMVRDNRLGPEPVPFGFVNDLWREFVAEIQPGDELWTFDSPQEEWDAGLGSEGIALVRDGAVVATQISRMN